MTHSQCRFLVFWDYMLILLFTVILAFVLANIWQILIVQGRWKTSPLLLFYVFTFLTVTQRIMLSITFFEPFPSPAWFVFFEMNCPTTKLVVGLI